MGGDWGGKENAAMRSPCGDNERYRNIETLPSGEWFTKYEVHYKGTQSQRLGMQRQSGQLVNWTLSMMESAESRYEMKCYEGPKTRGFSRPHLSG